MKSNCMVENFQLCETNASSGDPNLFWMRSSPDPFLCSTRLKLPKGLYIIPILTFYF